MGVGLDGDAAPLEQWSLLPAASRAWNLQFVSCNLNYQGGYVSRVFLRERLIGGEHEVANPWEGKELFDVAYFRNLCGEGEVWLDVVPKSLLIIGQRDGRLRGFVVLLGVVWRQGPALRLGLVVTIFL